MQSFVNERSRPVALHAEDVPVSVDHEADLSKELQLVLEAASGLLRLDQVTEHPDLRSLPLDVGVTGRQP